MADIKRVHHLLSQSAVKETIQRLQRYLQIDDSAASSKPGEIAVARGSALRSMEDLLSFLRDDVILVSRTEAEATNLSEQQLREKIAALEAEIEASKVKAQKRRVKQVRKLEVDHIT